jgi:hypothetical protein
LRRHRLTYVEVGPVKRAIVARLRELLEDREDDLEAEILMRVLYRFNNPRAGKPDYPLFSWGFLAEVLRNMEPLRRVPA